MGRGQEGSKSPTVHLRMPHIPLYYHCFLRLISPHVDVCVCIYIIYYIIYVCFVCVFLVYVLCVLCAYLHVYRRFLLTCLTFLCAGVVSLRCGRRSSRRSSRSGSSADETHGYVDERDSESCYHIHSRRSIYLYLSLDLSKNSQTRSRHLYLETRTAFPEETKVTHTRLGQKPTSPAFGSESCPPFLILTNRCFLLRVCRCWTCSVGRARWVWSPCHGGRPKQSWWI